MCASYIPPQGSPYYQDETFTDIQRDIMSYSKRRTIFSLSEILMPELQLKSGKKLMLFFHFGSYLK